MPWQVEIMKFGVKNVKEHFSSSLNYCGLCSPSHGATTKGFGKVQRCFVV